MFGVAYITLLSLILSFIAHGCYVGWKLKKQLHILQLNSYFNSRYTRWLSNKKRQIFSFKELEPLLVLVGVFFQTPLVVLVLFLFVYLRLFLVRPITPEKKPLVFTARAIRLYAFNICLLAFLYSSIFIAWLYKGNIWLEVAIGLLVIYSFLVPFALILTNAMIYPIEKLIQSWYYRDAVRHIRKLDKLKIIGITGSFGKTTTKYVLNEILRHKFNVLKTPGSFNTTMGVTKIIRSELKPIHEAFVVEMSAKKLGDIKELCDLVNPKYGLITAIGEQHLETFKTLENIKKTKNELMESLPDDGIAFYNMDDANTASLASAAKCRVVKYGIDADNLDYRVDDLSIDGGGSTFSVTSTKSNELVSFQTKLLGKHNIYNIVGAIAVASELGIKLSEMVYPLRQLCAIPHRLELKKIGKGVVFIDDAFNSNPVGSKMALDVLKQISGQRKIIVTPGMIELGVKEEEYNEQFGEYIAEACDYVILVGKQQTLAIQKGLKTKNYLNKNLFVAVDFAAAKKHLDGMLQEGDVVLFENDLPDNYN